MKTLPYLVGSAILALASSGLHAQNAPTGRSAADVQAEAIAAAHAPDQNGAAGTRGFGPFTSTADPEKVRREAVETANAPDQNGATGTRGFGDFKGTADPAAVAAGARETASAPDQNVASGSKFNSKVPPSTLPNPASASLGK
ncbi:hypothetical protein [Variovorax sp. YR216]|uniref:hypothetical protein n=1 Tax=Variovorax sp. YR216 TaxID=1882828 RepID=UPI000899BD5B|nr:hypothetical protein [Variovorax sp. YR216]SEB25581.1 hypothetical protein SAMN05444680_12620 [Variovorax sp. YR216]